MLHDFPRRGTQAALRRTPSSLSIALAEYGKLWLRTPVPMEAMIGMFSAADPDEPASTWQTLRQALQDGFQSIDRRLQAYGPLKAVAVQPARSQPTLGEAPGADGASADAVESRGGLNTSSLLRIARRIRWLNAIIEVIS